MKLNAFIYRLHMFSEANVDWDHIMSERVAVYISKELYEKVKRFVEEQGGFSSVEEFVEFVLNEVLSGNTTSRELSKEDEERVKERLRALGYI